MIVFWRDHHGIINRGNVLIRTVVLNPYQIEYKEKVFEIDTIDKHDINVMVIPMFNIYSFQYNREIKLLIEMATDKGIKCFLGWEYEYVTLHSRPYYKEFGTLIDNIDHMKEYDVKIISNRESHKSLIKFEIKDHEDWKENNYLIIDQMWARIAKFDLFKYETRASQIRTDLSQELWKFNTHYTSRKNKKYNFTALCGSISKKQNALLFTALYMNGLLNDKNFWTTIYHERDQKLHGHWNVDPRLIDWYMRFEKTDYAGELLAEFFKIKDKIFQTKLFDSLEGEQAKNGRPSNRQERRIPQQYYDSHFSLCIETTRNQAFYTEKTYKPISIGLPFLIFGSWYQNTVLKDTYGYELFDEIWDYSFEIPPKNILEVHQMALGDYIKNYVEQISKVMPDAERIFKQPSVIEKAEYNRELFEKTTTRKCLIKDLNRIFGAGDIK